MRQSDHDVEVYFHLPYDIIPVFDRKTVIFVNTLNYKPMIYK